jgi:hypothetical protein
MKLGAAPDGWVQASSARDARSPAGASSSARWLSHSLIDPNAHFPGLIANRGAERLLDFQWSE